MTLYEALSLHRFSKHLVPLSKHRRIRPKRWLTWQLKDRALKALQPVAQHRTINLIQHIGSYLDHVIRPNPEDVRIERGVV